MRIAAALVLAAMLAGASSEDITLTATSVNVAQPGTPVKIRIVRWSTEDERRPIVTALAAPPAQPSEVARANAAAAGRGRAGRGRGRGGPAQAPLSPIDAFAAALRRAPTIGYIWTNDITGYSIKYAWHASRPDGTDRIVLVSDRRLGAYTGAWTTASDAPNTDYTFTLIEMHVGADGSLVGKTSLTTKVTIDSDAMTVALENFTAAATTLTGTPRRAGR